MRRPWHALVSVYDIIASTHPHGRLRVWRSAAEGGLKIQIILAKLLIGEDTIFLCFDTTNPFLDESHMINQASRNTHGFIAIGVYESISPHLKAASYPADIFPPPLSAFS